MIFWSLKTLFSEPLRLIVSSLAVAVSFLLVIFFSAVFEGESEQMVAYLEKMNTDVWVMQKRCGKYAHGFVNVVGLKAQKIAKLHGVKEVSAILFLNGPVKIGDKDWFSYIIGISPEYRRAGPWDMMKGKAIPAPGEAVIPEVITQLTGIQIGDEITINNRHLTVVGLTRGTFSMASSIIFVSHDDLGDLVEGRDQYSYIMVYAEPNTSSSTLIEEIKNNIDKINVLSNEDFIKSDKQLAVQMGAEIIYMMTIIGTLLATLIVAFTSYSLIARKKQELAIAKALGFRNGDIYLAALCQSVIITSIGLLLTLLLSYTLLMWLPTFVPQINLSVQIYQFIPIAVISLPIAIFASLAAAHTVIKVDPMAVLLDKIIMTTDLILKATNIKKYFGSGASEVHAVEDVSLNIKPGEMVLIMGPSGSGKTTLLSMLGALLGPTSGDIIIDGADITSMDDRDLAELRAKKIGFVFQAFNLLEALNVEQNILFPAQLNTGGIKAAKTRLNDLLDRLGLSDRRFALPNTLSGGEKQRVAIARALINQPPIILADEPTGNLDSHKGQEVMMILHDIARDDGCAVLMVTHDPRVEEIADRVLWLEDGQIRDRKSEKHSWVKDPVCGMRIDEWTATVFTEYKNQRFVFCSQRCLERFNIETEKYTK